MKKHLRSAQAIGALTIVSRILGLLRDVLCAAFLGAGMLWDAFVLAWTIPNLFRMLFGEGALSSAFIPVFTKIKESEGLQKALEFTRITLTYFGLLLLGIILLFYLIGLPLYWNFSLPPKYTLILESSFFLVPYLFFICLAAVCGGALNSLDHFALPAFLPIVLNIVWIAAMLVGSWWMGGGTSLVLFMSFWLLVGGMMQFSIVWLGLKRKGLSLLPLHQPQDSHLQEVKALMFPVVLGLATMQINVIMDRIIAETLVKSDGAVSALYYANRLIQFPLAIIGIAIATAIFPSLSKLALQKDEETFQSTLTWALRMAAYISLPAMVGLMILSDPIIHLFFKRGKFDAEATRRTALVLLYYSPTVLFHSLNHVITRAFYAHKNTTAPVRVSTAMVGVNLVLNLIFVFLLEESGLALATSISSGLNFLILCYLFVKNYQTLPWRGMVPSFLRSLFCALLMVAGIAVALSWWPSQSSSFHQMLRLCAMILLGVLVYALSTWILRAEEFQDLRGSLHG